MTRQLTGESPPAALDRLVEALRALDMDDVRRRIADDEAGAAGG